MSCHRPQIERVAHKKEVTFDQSSRLSTSPLSPEQGEGEGEGSIQEDEYEKALPAYIGFRAGRMDVGLCFQEGPRS